MNYQKIYDSIIKGTKYRTNLVGYFEKHHIIPTALGGRDNSDNIVRLTAKEHFIAHLLLAKIYGGPMVTAAFLMSTRGKKSRTYSMLREQYLIRVKGNKERGRKISASLLGQMKTDKHLTNWKNSRSLGSGWERSEEQNKKLSVSVSGDKNPMFGKTHTEEARKIISDANKQTIKCPHCGKIGGIAIMKRWHFAKCKHVKSTAADSTR